MKTLEEIKHIPNLLIAQTSEDGGYGVLFRCGKRFASVIRKALTRPPQSWCYVEELPCIKRRKAKPSNGTIPAIGMQNN